MSDSSDNSTMVAERALKKPKRLQEIAMMKLIHMLYERVFPRILRLNPNINSAGGSDAIREEALAARDWIYQTLSCSVADDVQKLILKSICLLVDEPKWFIYHRLRYWFLLLIHPKCCSLRYKWFFDDMINVTDMLQSFIHLKHIELELVHSELTHTFATNLKNCTRLRVFVCDRGCNDEIIRVLSQNCPVLSELKVGSSVTDESTHYVKNMKSLKNCCIKRTSITIEGVVRILKNCTQLCKLDMKHDTRDILKSLEDSDDPVQLSLRTVELHDDRNITPHVGLLKKYCPFLTHVGVGFGCKSTVPLCQLGSVKQLTIQEPDYKINTSASVWYSTLNTWLIVDNINVITLSRVEISNEGLVELSNAFPNITELYAYVYLTCSNGYVLSEYRPFQKLKKLQFKNFMYERGRYRERDSKIFKILLSYCRMVTHVCIRGLNIDDSTVDTIFETNQMPCLQHWQVEQTECTSKTFYLLFDKCPMLKFIGVLKTWKIRADEAQEVENYIRQRNYDLHIDMSDPDDCLESFMESARYLLIRNTARSFSL